MSGRVCKRWEMAVGFKWRVSTDFDPSESTFDHFQDVGHFPVNSNGLTVFPEGPRTLRDRPEGPRDPVGRCYGGLMLLPEGLRILREYLEGSGML